MAMNAIEVARALFSSEVDTRGIEEGLSEIEKMVEEGAGNIGAIFAKLGPEIAVGIGVAVVGAIHHAVEKTAEWGIEMEHLGERLGITSREASQFVGMMQRVGISAEAGARGMTMLSVQIKETANSMDPFSTRLGKMFGNLRDANGQVMNTAQVMELAHQKILAASDSMQQLAIAQDLLGTRMGGRMLPLLKLQGEEWDKMKNTVPQVDEAISNLAESYEKSSNDMKQAWQGLMLTIGKEGAGPVLAIEGIVTRSLGAVKQFSDYVLPLVNKYKDFILPPEIAALVHLVGMGKTPEAPKTEDVKGKGGLTDEQRDLLTTKGLETAKQTADLWKQAYESGVATTADLAKASQDELQAVNLRRRFLEEQSSKITGSGPIPDQQRLDLEKQILDLKVQGAKVLAEQSKRAYEDEKLRLDAVGALNIGNEIALQQKRLEDETISGQERLKIEADIYQKRKQYAEQLIDVGKKMGTVTGAQEFAYRQGRAQEALGKGDIVGAAQEALKARDVAMQAIDQTLQAAKLVRTVGWEEEVDFARRKLELVKGNADEELKILNDIATKDKAIYDERLSYNLSYTKDVTDSYQRIMAAAKSTGDVETFAQARAEGNRNLVEGAREAAGVLHGGGTAQQREAAVGFAQDVFKKAEESQKLGVELSSSMKDILPMMREILEAASGGTVRDPTGPNPTVGSLLSSTEGLATSSLARGSEIPRLDTSFTDLAVRIRDVLNFAIPQLQNFGNALAESTKKISGSTGVTGINLPGNPQPQGQPALPVAPNSLAQPSVPGQAAPATSQLQDLSALTAAITDMTSRLVASQSQNDATQKVLADAANRLIDASGQSVDVNVNFDPQSGQGLAEIAKKQLVNELKP